MALQKSRPAVGSFFAGCGSALALVSACTCAESWAQEVGGTLSEFESLSCQGCTDAVFGANDAGQRKGGLPEWRVELRSARYSDPLPLRYFGQADWAQRVQARPGLNLVQFDQSMSLQRVVNGSGHQWSLVLRQLGRVILDDTTALRIQQIDSGAEAAQDWQWHPQLTYRGLAGYGLGWAYRPNQHEGMYFEGGTQVLTVSSLSARDFSGAVDFNATSQRYAFNVQSTQSANRLVFPFQKPHDSAGLALLLNARVGWRSNPWHFSVGMRDAGWLRWQGLPSQFLNYNTQTQVRDANGHILYRPLVQGQNTQSDVRWSAPWTGELEASVNLTPHVSLSMPWEYVPRFGWLPAMRWQDHVGALKWSITWRQHQKDVQTQWHWGAWSLTFAAGRIRNSQDLALSCAFVF